jgi:hypothetical protein
VEEAVGNHVLYRALVTDAVCPKIRRFESSRPSDLINGC